jgi:hypothetical protein
MMKVTCERKLGDEEMEMLVAEAKMMDVLAMNKTWVGDGMLYRTTKEGEFHFEDANIVTADALRKGVR